MLPPSWVSVGRATIAALAVCVAILHGAVGRASAHDDPAAPSELPASSEPSLPSILSTASTTSTPSNATPTVERRGRDSPPDPIAVLVFIKTTVFVHESIPDGVAMLQDVGDERDWSVTATDDAAIFTDDGLAPFEVLVFLSTSGDVLDETQQDAFIRYIQAGGGFVGIHSATDTEYDWPWYRDLIGDYFDSHPAEQTAAIDVENRGHPATDFLPKRFERFDEWYNYRGNPRGHVTVLMTLDEASYDAGPGAMGADHPIAWYHYFDGGRSFYTGLGHTIASYHTDDRFREHVTRGIEWAAGRIDAPTVDVLRAF